MALTNSFEKFGTTFEGAYHRITNLNYTVSEFEQTIYPEPEVDEEGNPVLTEPTTEWTSSKKANFQVSTYVDADARLAHAQPVASDYCEFTPDWDSEDNVLAQAYAYLKTLDAYAGSTDV